MLSTTPLAIRKAIIVAIVASYPLGSDASRR
jgi:hypothetical protein